MPKMSESYTFHSDPGHGWLAVPIDEVTQLGLAISNYSYTDGATVYLEEDLDATAFLNAYEEVTGTRPFIGTMRYDSDAPCRSMTRWRNSTKERGAYYE